MIFTEQDHARLATLFGGVAVHKCPVHPTQGRCKMREPLAPYPGYRPEVREAPNGDTRLEWRSDCGAVEVYNPADNDGAYSEGDTEDCGECDSPVERACQARLVRVPNVDAGPAGKRYLHVAPKYNPPAWAVEYLARAHYEACRVAEALGVPAAYYPRVADGTLRVLEYPSAAHTYQAERTLEGAKTGAESCTHCGRDPIERGSGVCPALAPGAGTVEHKDFDLFTIVLWRSTPEDLELSQPDLGTNEQTFKRRAGLAISPGLHIGEIGELVGLGPATPHRVPARPYAQKSIVYFAMPDHAAPLECECPRPDLHGHRPYAYKTEPQARCTGTTVGAWLKERLKRSRYT